MEAHEIPHLPSSAYYIPSFLTPSEETHILNTLSRLPTNKWTTLSHRRLLSLPSTLSGSLNDTLLSAPLPSYLTEPILSRFASLDIFTQSPHQNPNHVLVNEYLPSQGIMPHTDGPAYHPITATVSLGSHTVLDIYAKNPTDGSQREAQPRPQWRILQEPRSLLVTTGELYTDTLHGIAEVEVDEDLGEATIVNWGLLGDRAVFEAESGGGGGGKKRREKRVSLTYRDVKKVAKVGGALKFLGKR